MSTFESLLIGKSPQLQSVIRAAQIASATDVTVLIQGESGTGKELLAQALHRESRRAEAPLVAVNCAALPQELAESELFGHRRGAFTGAVSDQPGRIRAAAGGTLFLDELAEFPLSLQAKLLRFLESGECHAVGASRPERIDVRIVAATNRDLFAEVEAGRFRQDLYYRLNVIPLQLPPLRERHGDLEPLLDTLTGRLAEQHGLQPPRYNGETLSMLKRYAWPGNVRELRNFCERTLVLMSGQEITPANLPAEIRSQVDDDRGAHRELVSLPEQGLRLYELERSLIGQALDRARGNRSQAARLLGISRDTLLYRIKKYAL